MRIGTLSLNINTDDFNYGAILHSWAMQQWLLKQPYVECCEVVDYITPSVEYFDKNNPVLSMIQAKRPRAAMRYLINYRLYQDKNNKFKEFVDKQIIRSSEQYFQDTLSTASLPYDTIICESDVIWSPGFFGGEFDPAFFLALKSMEKKLRIAYAPSLADGNLTIEQGLKLEELLKNLDAISCRESYAVEILRQHTKKEVAQVVDPVLLLEANDYESIICKSHETKPYLLMYLPVDDNKKLRETAVKYANEKGLNIVEVDTKLRKKGGSVKSIINAGVEEFLTYIKNADVIFTNSFHAICFALLFKKEFYAFSRGNAGKVRDICESMGLPQRFFPDNCFKSQEEIDYQMVYRKLKEKREFSRKWLADALINLQCTQ